MNKFTILIFLALFFSNATVAKEYDKDFVVKFNPSVDFPSLDFSTITVFFFTYDVPFNEGIAYELYLGLDKTFKEKSVGYIAPVDNASLPKKDEFSLNSVSNGGTDALYKTASSDLVLSGTIHKADYYMKKMGKTYWNIDMELFIYSKSLETVTYKVNTNCMISASHLSDSFKALFLDLLNPLFESRNHPGENPADIEIKKTW